MPAKKQTKTVETKITPAIEMVSARFRALGEPTRLLITRLLEGGEKTVGELVELSGSGQANVSKHLSILREAGAVTYRKSGLSTNVSVSGWVKGMADQMLGTVKADHAAKAAALGE